MARAVNSSLLWVITRNIVSWIEAEGNEFWKYLEFANYHGFMKAKLTPAWMLRIIRFYGIEEGSVQVEIVRVESDLSDQVHRHHKSHACVVVLGTEHRVADPKNAFRYLDGTWSPVSANQHVNIPPGRVHGFTVRHGGSMYFLSVQSPPIEGEDGHDDYELVTDRRNDRREEVPGV